MTTQIITMVLFLIVAVFLIWAGMGDKETHQDWADPELEWEADD